jgi:hypothetical protein
MTGRCAPLCGPGIMAEDTPALRCPRSAQDPRLYARAWAAPARNTPSSAKGITDDGVLSWTGLEERGPGIRETRIV